MLRKLAATSVEAKPTAVEAEAEVSRLAALPPIDYALERKDAADRLTIPVGLLDDLVTARRPKRESNGQSSPFPEIVPLDCEVDGESMLDSVYRAIRDHVVVDDAEAAIATLWIAHTHGFEAFRVTPRLILTSATMRCGKTRFLDVIAHLVPKPFRAASISEAVLFRATAAYKPSLLYDEADRSLDVMEGLIGLLNAGHSPDTPAWRIEGEGNDRRLTPFPVHAPCAIAGIGKIPGTLRDRGFLIEMRRKHASEKVGRLDRNAISSVRLVARGCAKWISDNLDALRAATPPVPEALDDRAADNAEPLLAIADLAGGLWPMRARAALVAVCTKRAEDEGDIGVRLIHDIHRLFNEKGEQDMASKELVDGLTGQSESPWLEVSQGKPLTPARLARMLKRFKVGPTQIRNGQARGYTLAGFLDAFARYPLPESVKVSESPQNKDNSQIQSVISFPAPDTLKSAKRPENTDVLTLRHFEGEVPGEGANGGDAQDDADERLAFQTIDGGLTEEEARRRAEEGCPPPEAEP